MAEYESARTDAPDRIAEHVGRAFAPDGQVVATGTDVAVLAPDERIQQPVVFDGALPPEVAGRPQPS